MGRNTNLPVLHVTTIVAAGFRGLYTIYPEFAPRTRRIGLGETPPSWEEDTFFVAARHGTYSYPVPTPGKQKTRIYE